MSDARQILPGKILLVTRRCSERRYFLRPDEKTNTIFRYLLAVMAERHGVELIAAVAMANQ